MNIAHDTIFGLCLTANILLHNKKEINQIKDIKSSACELIFEIFKQDKCNIKELLAMPGINGTYKGSLLHWILDFGGNNLKNIIENYDKNKKIDFYIKDYNQNIEYRTALEWIANYGYDILKELGQMGYLDSNKKEENLKILINLVGNDSGRNINVKIAPFFKSLLTHEPPLFCSNLNSIKQAICQKTLKVSLTSSQLLTFNEKYNDILQDHNNCLMEIHRYEVLHLGDPDDLFA